MRALYIGAHFKARVSQEGAPAPARSLLQTAEGYGQEGYDALAERIQAKEMNKALRAADSDDDFMAQETCPAGVFDGVVHV